MSGQHSDQELSTVEYLRLIEMKLDNLVESRNYTYSYGNKDKKQQVLDLERIRDGKRKDIKLQKKKEADAEEEYKRAEKNR